MCTAKVIPIHENFRDQIFPNWLSILDIKQRETVHRKSICGKSTLSEYDLL